MKPSLPDLTALPPPDAQPTEQGVYTVQTVLGTGALCEVLRAVDPSGRPVVLKRLHRHCAVDPDLVAMFRHEAYVLAALDHPGLPLLLAHGRDSGGWFLVQAHLTGVDLATVIEASPGAHLAAGVEAVRQLLSALSHAHTRKDPDGVPLEIVHRDVAPANILVGTDGAITLLDWGIATSVWRRDPDRGRMKGTRGYMAPEVVTGAQEADARSDLFAVGVVLYELTVGRRLYPGGAMQVMLAVAEGPLPSALQDVQGYPPALDAVVRTALARDPGQRYPTAMAMAEALDAAGRTAEIPCGRDTLADLARRTLAPG